MNLISVMERIIHADDRLDLCRTGGEGLQPLSFVL